MKNRKTKNIQLATVWLALGAIFVGVDRSDISHQEFEFSPGKDNVVVDRESPLVISREIDLDAIETQLANKSLMVNANDLFDAFQRMKSIIHSR